MGMGHAGRARAILPHLQQHFDVHLFAGGPARALLARHHPQVHWVHRPRYFFWRGRVSEALIYAYILLTLPLTVLSVAWLMARLLVTRPAAVVTDFETHLTYAAWLVRPLLNIPVIAIDHMAAFRFAQLPGFGAQDAAFFQRMARQHQSIVPYATLRLVPYFTRLEMDAPNVRWVPPPVRAGVVEAQVTSSGPVVVYVGVLLTPGMRAVLEAYGPPVEVFGAEASATVGAVKYHRHDEERFLSALAAAPFAVLHGGHMSLVDALALGKPVLVCPTPGHREQAINARVLGAVGAGRQVEQLTVEALRDMARDVVRLAGVAAEKRNADPAALAGEIIRAVR